MSARGNGLIKVAHRGFNGINHFIFTLFDLISVSHIQNHGRWEPSLQLLISREPLVEQQLTFGYSPLISCLRDFLATEGEVFVPHLRKLERNVQVLPYSP
jgi:hypothetical protein